MHTRYLCLCETICTTSNHTRHLKFWNIRLLCACPILMSYVKSSFSVFRMAMKIPTSISFIIPLLLQAASHMSLGVETNIHNADGSKGSQRLGILFFSFDSHGDIQEKQAPEILCRVRLVGIKSHCSSSRSERFN